MGAVRLQHARNAPGCYQLAGEAGPIAAATAGTHAFQGHTSVPLARQEAATCRFDACISAQARETGICPVREELYAQCFDELIRQVTINCAERGLLLLRVRDEMRMTIAAYQVGSAWGSSCSQRPPRHDADIDMPFQPSPPSLLSVQL